MGSIAAIIGHLKAHFGKSSSISNWSNESVPRSAISDAKEDLGTDLEAVDSSEGKGDESNHRGDLLSRPTLSPSLLSCSRVFVIKTLLVGRVATGRGALQRLRQRVAPHPLRSVAG